MDDYCCRPVRMRDLPSEYDRGFHLVEEFKVCLSEEDRSFSSHLWSR